MNTIEDQVIKVIWTEASWKSSPTTAYKVRATSFTVSDLQGGKNNDIMAVNGHHSEQSIRHYSKLKSVNKGNSKWVQAMEHLPASPMVCLGQDLHLLQQGLHLWLISSPVVCLTLDVDHVSSSCTRLQPRPIPANCLVFPGTVPVFEISDSKIRDCSFHEVLVMWNSTVKTSKIM